jgi:hypothetical protein
MSNDPEFYADMLEDLQSRKTEIEATLHTLNWTAAQSAQGFSIRLAARTAQNHPAIRFQQDHDSVPRRHL